MTPHTLSQGTAQREAGLGAGLFLLSENLSPTFPARILGESACCERAWGKPVMWEGTVAHGVSHPTLVGSWYQKWSAPCPPSTSTAANAASFFRLRTTYFSLSPPGHWFPCSLPYGLEALGLVLVWGMLALHLLASDHLVSLYPQSERENKCYSCFSLHP